MTRKMIIDTDPGHDDAMAILLATRYFDVLGITTVHGNQSVEKTTQNALKVLELGGLTHIPVAKGCATPLVQPPRHAVTAHGESGLDGPDLPEPTTKPVDAHAVDFLIERLMAEDAVTLVPIGPLTNVGMALQREPRIREHIDEISLMGGSATLGNSTAVAELNIWCDPEAASIVFNSGIPIRMVGLNLTRQTVADQAIVDRMAALGNRVGKIASEIIAWYSAQTKKMYGLKGASVHDACAVAWLIDPTLIESVLVHVDVELNGTLTRGMTVCDMRWLQAEDAFEGDEAILRGKSPNTHVGMKIDQARFFDLLIETLGQYP
jgi:inosine-uridine nucleoside N-ribohydrolase